MTNYDVVIIGAGTSGAYLAEALAKRGHKVAVIEKLPQEKVGTKFDIFHIEEKEFARLGLPRPVEGDPAWAFEFEKNRNADPKNLYPKCQTNPVVGLHLHEYTRLLGQRAKEAGAEFFYARECTGFLFDEKGKICGVRTKHAGKEKDFYASLTADCSGMAAALRTRLPDGFPVDNSPLTDEDMFYVILRYVKLKNPADYLDGSTFWASYKAWIAPSGDPTGAIIGIGACHSFDYAEEVFREMEKVVPLPEYDLLRIERGRTPYTHNPYSMVGDGFFVSGDAANLTKSVNGEGVTSSMVQLRLAVPTLDRALKLGKVTTDYMWEINRKYNAAQGAEFAMLRALLVGVVNAAGLDEFEYAFESGLVSDELLNAAAGAPLSPGVLARASGAFVSGMAKKRIRASTVKAAGAALRNAVEISSHYKNFPVSPEGFGAWKQKADELYRRIGKIK